MTRIWWRCTKAGKDAVPITDEEKDDLQGEEISLSRNSRDMGIFWGHTVDLSSDRLQAADYTFKLEWGGLLLVMKGTTQGPEPGWAIPEKTPQFGWAILDDEALSPAEGLSPERCPAMSPEMLPEVVRARGGPDEGAYSAAGEVIQYMSNALRLLEQGQIDEGEAANLLKGEIEDIWKEERRALRAKREAEEDKPRTIADELVPKPPAPAALSASAKAELAAKDKTIRVTEEALQSKEQEIKHMKNELEDAIKEKKDSMTAIIEGAKAQGVCMHM